MAGAKSSSMNTMAFRGRDRHGPHSPDSLATDSPGSITYTMATYSQRMTMTSMFP